MFSKWTWANWRRNQRLTHSKPYSVEELQKSLKRDLEDHNWDQPYEITMAADKYPLEVVDWCVAWLNCCYYRGKSLSATHTLEGKCRVIYVKLNG
jgi:hypothetical protein